MTASAESAMVLITDGNERSGLAVTRALGAHRIRVIVGAETVSSLAGSSRHCADTIRYPAPADDPHEFVECLLRAVRTQKITMLIPVTDLAAQLIGERRAEFDQYTTVPMPALSVYETVTDKYRLMELAQELNVPIPDTRFVPDGQVLQNDHVAGGYPLIVKPGRSRVKVDGKWVATKVHLVRNRDELEQLYRHTPYLLQSSLIQQRVEGEGQGIFALCDRGTPVALFAHRRLREKPPWGGVSVLRESIELPKAMSDHAVRLLQHVGWHGVAMVEFKVGRHSGTPYLMEINGRFWGSLQLACDAGVNFPLMLYHMATHQPVGPPRRGYQAGVKSRWLLGDLDHLILRLFKGNSALGLPSDYPSRLRCLLDFARLYQKGQFYEVERWDDLGPSRHEVRQYLTSLVGFGK